MCIVWLLGFMFLCHLCAMCPQRPKEGWDPWNCSFEQLWTAFWVLGNEPLSSGRATLTYSVIYFLDFIFLMKYYSAFKNNFCSFRGWYSYFIKLFLLYINNRQILPATHGACWLSAKCSFLFTSYKGPLLDDGALSQAVCAGATSPEFTKLCAWLVSELRVLCKLEENVQATNSK